MTGAGTAVPVKVVRCEHCGRNNRVPAVADGAPSCGNCHQPLPWIADADDASFSAVAEQADLPVLVDLWATWCGPCRMVSPALERVAGDLAGRVKLVKVDVDASPSISERFEIRAVPTLMVLRNGTVVARRSGAAPAADIRRWVQDALGPEPAEAAR
jgi:thioredoxin 2